MKAEEFTKASVEERIEYLKENSPLTAEDLELIHGGAGLPLKTAEEMVENVIGTYQVPYCAVPGFIINGKKMTIPMVGEEPYVHSSTGNGARLAALSGGFITGNTGSIMIGQVQLTKVANPYTSRAKVLEHKAELIELANTVDPFLVKLGGGCQDIEARIVDSPVETFLIVHLIIDVKDAMGAQVINGMAEAISGKLEEITGAKANIKVLSNYATTRITRARVMVKKEDLGGEAAVDKIVSAYNFANNDPYRAATNNKGIMNGMIPVVVATGNDTRAVESGVHSYAARSGQYRSISRWEKNANGDLEGMIEVPMVVGIVGGTTKLHPIAQLSLKLMGIESAQELADAIVCTGLAAHLGVLYSLTTVGLRGDFDAARGK